MADGLKGQLIFFCCIAALVLFVFSIVAAFIYVFNQVYEPTEFEIQCLHSHNKYRAKHGSPPLKLKKDLTDLATGWVVELASDISMHLTKKAKYGENILILESEDVTGDDAVKAWYNEIKNYNYDEPKISKETQHFTQVIWKSTYQMGCGSASKANRTFVVCDYFPAGNVKGSIKTNVPHLKGDT